MSYSLLRFRVWGLGFSDLGVEGFGLNPKPDFFEVWGCGAFSATSPGSGGDASSTASGTT